MRPQQREVGARQPERNCGAAAAKVVPDETISELPFKLLLVLLRRPILFLFLLLLLLQLLLHVWVRRRWRCC